jgi:hypothetical protein
LKVIAFAPARMIGDPTEFALWEKRLEILNDRNLMAVGSVRFLIRRMTGS